MQLTSALRSAHVARSHAERITSGAIRAVARPSAPPASCGRGATAPAGSTSLLPVTLQHRRQHAARMSATTGSDQPLAGDNPLAEVEREEERGVAFGTGFVVLLCTGLAQVLAPSRVVQLGFAASPLPVVDALVRQLGTIYILAALAMHCLQEAALHERLKSDTYQRLGLGLMWWGLTSLVVLWLSPAKPLLRPTLAVSALLGFTAASTAHVYNQTSEQGLNPLYLTQQLLSSLGSLFSIPNLWAGVYAAYTALAGAAALAIWACSSGAWAQLPGGLGQRSLLAAPLGGVGTLELKFLGSGALLLAVVLFTLKDAAARGRLGASTFKTLNVGVLVTALSLSGIAAAEPCLFANAQLSIAVLLLSGVLAVTAAFNYFFAKKK